MPPKDGKVHVQARYFEDTLPYTVKSTRLHISIDASLNDLCTLLEQQCGGRVTVTDLFKVWILSVPTIQVFHLTSSIHSPGLSITRTASRHDH